MILGLLLGTSIQLVGLFLIRPLLSRFFGIDSVDPRDLSSLTDRVPLFFAAILGQWLLAGLGEEAVFRGYLLNRLIDLAGDGVLGLLISIIISSVLFSSFHGLLGVPFFLLAFITGVIYSMVYLASNRNLLITVIAHATANSIGIGLLYLR
jgi:membrane protease YdiL (CAAX protease family)